MSESIAGKPEEVEFVLDEAASLLHFKIPLNPEEGLSIPFEVTFSDLEEKDLRALRTRESSYEKAMTAFNQAIFNSTSSEVLERAEQGLFSVKDYFIAILRKIFMSDAVKITAHIHDEKGLIIDKKRLADWMQGDFLIAWGMYFYPMVESQMILLKKKVDSSPSHSSSEQESSTS